LPLKQLEHKTAAAQVVAQRDQLFGGLVANV
jgi:hypothetical protein